LYKATPECVGKKGAVAKQRRPQRAVRMLYSKPSARKGLQAHAHSWAAQQVNEMQVGCTQGAAVIYTRYTARQGHHLQGRRERPPASHAPGTLAGSPAGWSAGEGQARVVGSA